MNKTILAVTIPIILIVGATAYIAFKSSDNPTETAQSTQQSSANIIETTAYKISAPEGVTNNSANVEAGSIDLDVEKSYGTMSVEIFTSSLITTSGQDTGTSTEAIVEIAGMEATRTDTDYALVITGPSDVPLIRYSIRFDGIEKPSAEKKTKITINLLSTDDVSNEDLEQFKQDAQDILDSLVIK